MRSVAADLPSSVSLSVGHLVIRRKNTGIHQVAVWDVYSGQVRKPRAGLTPREGALLGMLLPRAGSGAPLIRFLISVPFILFACLYLCFPAYPFFFTFSLLISSLTYFLL